MKSLINIDCELVRIFRLEGRPDLARMVWETYRRDLKNQGKQAINDYLKHQYAKKKIKGFCVVPDCNNYSSNWVVCKKHKFIKKRTGKLWHSGISAKSARTFRLIFG